MKTDLINTLETLHKTFQMEGYDIQSTVQYHHKNLIIVIKLKDNDMADVMKAWSEVRQIEGG